MKESDSIRPAYGEASAGVGQIYSDLERSSSLPTSTRIKTDHVMGCGGRG